MAKETKIDKERTFRLYTMYVHDAAVANEAGFYDKANTYYWMAMRLANRLGFTAPGRVLHGANIEQQKIDAEKAVS